MLDILGKLNRYCDGHSRRDFLRCGALAIGGFTLADGLRVRAAAPAGWRDAAVIQIFMGGGPSQLDMYDMKPQAPREIRGEFREIATSVPGIRMCEHLPHQAQVMDRLAIVRSVTHGDSSHLPSSHFVLTGYAPNLQLSGNQYPFVGSIVSRFRGTQQGLPPYVAVPRQVSFGNAAYLGPSCEPFVVDSDPNSANFEVRNLKLVAGLDPLRLQHRIDLLQQVDQLQRSMDARGALEGVDRYTRDALQLITSDRAAQAFDMSQEEESTRDRYGRTPIGQNCLLARRLVEAGVPYVTCLSGGGWDTHAHNFRDLREVTLPRYDRAIAALVSDLYERGLDKRVLVMAFGEFGRTPRINRDAGRDHWPGAMSVLLAGGGLKMGQMVGETDEQGAFPRGMSYSPRDILATMYRHMGIDPRTALLNRDGRPVPILPDGQPIEALL